MGPSSSSAGAKKPHPALPHSELDGLLVGSCYKVRSSDLCHEAHQLERLESAMVGSPSHVSPLASDAVLYNPADLVSWVDSLLSESTHQSSSKSNSSSRSLPVYLDDLFSAPTTSSWLHPEIPLSQPQQQLSVVTTMEEDSGIRLVHALMSCADSVQRGDFQLAGTLIDKMNALLTRVNTGCGIGKVAGYFIDALSRRVLGVGSAHGPAHESEILYHHFYEASPYLKFAHFTANQAILEAFEGYDCVHVIDFSLMHGLQWPALIQALALRPGGPPLLRLTGVGPPSPDGRDMLREIGLRLAELARSVNVRFAFRGVVASRLEDVKPWLLQVGPSEAVAINSIMQLHKLLGPDQVQRDDSPDSPIEAVLSWIRGLNPKIVILVEQEANHNQTGFLDRFTEALYYYSTMFDSFEAACPVQPDKALAEMYLQREICNIVCCEGAARVERHEPLAQWRERLGRAGFRPLHLGSNAFKQASMLLTLFSAEGYSVQETEGCLTLGWHSQPLIAASAWRPSPAIVGPQIDENDNN